MQRVDVLTEHQQDSFFSGVLLSSLPAILFGVQATLTAFLLVKGPPAKTDELTNLVGIFNFRPEYDVYVYLGGLLFTLALVAGQAWLWSRRLRPEPSVGRRGSQVTAWGIQLLLGAITSAAFLWGFVRAQQHVLRAEPVPVGYFILFAGTAGILIAASFFGARRHLRFSKVVSLPQWPRPRRKLWFPEVLFATLVVAIIYIPSWARLAGKVFIAEHFFHWDFFAMGPGLAYRSGAALGTEAFSFYGLGWPAFFALISPVVRLSYGSMMNMSALYGCVYFVGIYVLLRLVTNRPIWAATGTLLAMVLHLFGGAAHLGPLWRFPSLTVMRRPFDVWFFVALVLCLKSRRPTWLLGASALAAAGIVFETDTGAYLAAVLGLFWVAWLIQISNRRRDLALFFGSVLLGGLLLVVGLGVASRWTLLQPEFWAGWLQNLRYTAAGYTLMPMVGELELYASGGPSDWTTFTVFFAVFALYLLVLGNFLVRLLHRRLSPLGIFLGCLALYGFVSMNQYLGRSDPLNLFPPLIPLALLVVSLASLTDGMGTIRVSSEEEGERPEAAPWRFTRVVLPSIALSVVALSLLGNKAFQSYPNVFHEVVSGPPEGGLCLVQRFSDVCGLPVEHRAAVAQYTEVISKVGELWSSGEVVAFVDQEGPLFYQSAGADPWGTFLPMLPNLVTKERLRLVEEQLIEKPPPNVMIRPKATHDLFYEESWTKLYSLVQSRYTLTGQVGPFEHWRRSAGGVASADQR